MKGGPNASVSDQVQLYTRGMGQADQGAGGPPGIGRAPAGSRGRQAALLWYAFGDHDGYVLAEGSATTAVASALVTVAGSGAFRSVSTTVLLTVEETLDALRRAQRVAYRPPGG
jgi:hypothetical protein